MAIAVALLTYSAEDLQVIAHRAALSLAVASPSRRGELLREWTEPLDALEMLDVISKINSVLLDSLDVLRRHLVSEHTFEQGIETAKATVPPLPTGYPDPTRLDG